MRAVFERLTSHLLKATYPIAVASATAGFADPLVTLQGHTYAHFRNGDRKDPRSEPLVCVYLECDEKGVPVPLDARETEVLNAFGEQKEHKKNRITKNLLSASLTSFFNNKSFHVTEFGCGSSPISEYLPANTGITYHGIECDRNAIKALNQRGISASQWDDAPQALPDNKPAVALGVYSLHHMIGGDLASRICNFTRAGEGFYAGNYFANAHEQNTGAGRAKLAATLAEQGMAYIVLRDAAEKSNEFWLIGKPKSFNRMTEFTGVLQEKKKMLSGRSFQVSASHPG